MVEVNIMDRRKKWEIARRLKKTIVILKIIDPYSREKLLNIEFLIPDESDKLIKTIQDFR